MWQVLFAHYKSACRTGSAFAGRTMPVENVLLDCHVHTKIQCCRNKNRISYELKTEQEVHEYIDWGMQCAEQNPCVNYRYAVILKETGELIGSCELAFTDKDPAELAWELHRDYWRKGYGTEIGNTLLKLGFEILKLRRIIGDCNTLNTGSYRIMEKIGMRREAHYVKLYQGNSALNHREI